MEFKHISIMKNECIDALNINPDGIYVDATLGGSGHSSLIASKLTNGKLICLDKDDMALEKGKTRLKEYENNVILVKSDFRNIDVAVKNLGYDGVDGILFDLGVSSPQLDTPERGFSYMKDARLDMRMDTGQKLTAYDVVNTFSQDDIMKILFEYGEEKFARKISSNIIKKRETKPIETTLELADIIKYSMPPAARNENKHPAKRTFQAIRICVNDELSAVDEAIRKSLSILNPKGRLAVITFHSLEDRIVKNIMKENAIGCICPKTFPICICNNTPKVKIINKKAIVPTVDELEENHRARSSKLRVCEKKEFIKNE